MVSSLLGSTKSSLVAIAILAASLGTFVAASGLAILPAPTVLAGCDENDDDGFGGC